MVTTQRCDYDASISEIKLLSSSDDFGMEGIIGQRKRLLTKGDRFGVLVAVWRLALALQNRDQEQGIRRLLLEDEETDGWDDIVEWHEQDTGAVEWRIQVKSNSKELSKKIFHELLKNLGDDRQRLLILKSRGLRVPSVGRLFDLKQAMQDLKRGDPSRIAVSLSAKQGACVDRIQSLLQLDGRAATLEYLRYLSIDFTGPEEELQDRTMAILRTQFDAPERAFNRLLKIVEQASTSPDIIEISSLAGQLDDLAPPHASIPPGLEACRYKYLQGLQRELHDRSPLGPVLSGDVRLTDVHVTLQVQAGAASAPLLEFVDEAIAVGETALSLCGEVGTGKSTELETLALALAKRALTDQDAPVPLILKSEDNRVLAGSQDLADKLLSTVGPKVLFLDGMDEGIPSDQRLSNLDLLRARKDVRLVLAAGRPGSLPPRWRQLRLPSWSADSRDRFLNRWSDKDADIIAILRASPHLNEITQTPLLASYAVWVAKEDPEALHDRHSLFEAVTWSVFVRWVAERPDTPDQEEVERWWNELRPYLAELAWEAQSGQTLERRRVRQLLQKRLGFGPADRALDRSERLMGLLVETEGSYRFVSRPISEHLAGLHLVEHPEYYREALPLNKWCQVFQHAAAKLKAHDNFEIVLGWITQLLAIPMFAVQVGRTLRRVQVATELALELGEQARPVAQRIADALCLHLLEECSTWVGDEAAILCKDVAQRGGPIWEVLRPALEEHIQREDYQVALWYMAQLEDPTQDWGRGLFHRDPATRAEALRRFVLQEPDPQARILWLLGAVVDGGQSFWLPSPALMGAALLGEQLTRSPDEVLTGRLLKWLRSGRQRREVYAAVALPAGIEEEYRVEILSEIKTVYGPVETTLRKLTLARSRLEKLWPQWEEQSGPPRFSPPNMPSSVPPPTPLARRRLLSVLAIVPEFGRDLLKNEMRLSTEETEVICGLALSEPSLVIDLLNRRENVPTALYSHRASRLLAPAVVQHQRVRAALVDFIQETERRTAQDCPGGALEPVVLTNSEACIAYAKWLPRSFIALGASWRPNQELWKEVPELQQVAIGEVQRIWQWHEEKNGAPSTVGKALEHWWPSWVGEPTLMKKAFTWLGDDEPSKVTAALVALTSGPLPSPWSTHFWEQFDASISFLESNDQHHQLYSVVDALVARQIISPAALSFLQRHSRSSQPKLALVATAGLISHLKPEEARQESARAAKLWPCQLFTSRSRLDGLDRLVRANPEAWHERAEHLLAGGHVTTLVNVARHLPSAFTTKLLQKIPKQAFSPFWQNIEGGPQTARPLDILEHIAWQLGLDALPEPDWMS